MKGVAAVIGVLAAAFLLLAVGFQGGVTAYFRWADYMARRRDAHERTEA